MHSSLPPRPADASSETEPWVIPSYIRYVADEIAGHTHPSDPPEYHDLHHTSSFFEPLMLDWEEDDTDETALSRGISILCDFAADSAELCDWLMQVDVLMPCRILMKQKTLTIKEQQQIARLIALLSRTHFEGSRFVSWLPWLQRRIESSDLLLSSNAVRCLIHIQLGQAETTRHCPTFPDGIHFFRPQAQLSEGLTLRQKIDDGTVVDVVFVHGIRGGPYLTWRSGGTSDAHHSREACWPSHWLSEDVPRARLITVQFAAPVSGWEGGSGPLQHTAQQLLEKLREAGIGRRPLIFVAHSMGGLIVKELLCQAMEDRQDAHMAQNTCGMVFISTPHHGTLLARVAWGLRYFGACPAPSLNLMKPGPYLEQLNVRLRDWVKRRDVRVLSFAEMLPTDILSMIPRLRVVGVSSAFPGYGSVVRLDGMDHINSCKPQSRSDAFYRHFVTFLTETLQTFL